MLQKKGFIKVGALPFDVEVDGYFVNSSVIGKAEAPANTPNPATAGAGLQRVAVERPEVSGTGSEIDVPSVYVTLKKKGADQSLGTYLVSAWLSNQPGQKVDVDGKQFELSFRF